MPVRVPRVERGKGGGRKKARRRDQSRSVREDIRIGEARSGKSQGVGQEIASLLECQEWRKGKRERKRTKAKGMREGALRDDILRVKDGRREERRELKGRKRGRVRT